MFRRRRSTYDRTYSLQSYGSNGQPSPAALAAAATAGGNSRSNSMTSQLSSAAAATALRRHNSMTSDSIGSLNQLQRRGSSGSTSAGRPGASIPRTRTMTSVEGSGRSMSMTTTTIKQLGSFQLISTKTTPLRPPRRPGYAASHASFESDLNPVFEEGEASFDGIPMSSPRGTPARGRAGGGVAFGPVVEADEQRLSVKHEPKRSLSPMKSALKADNSLSPSVSVSSQATGDEQVGGGGARRKRAHRVSFTQEPEEFLIPDYSQQQQPQLNGPQLAAKMASRNIAAQTPARAQFPRGGRAGGAARPSSAAAAAAAGSPQLGKTTGGHAGIPVGAARQTQAASAAHDADSDSDSGASVYSDAFEEFEPRKGTRKPRRREHRANGTVANGQRNAAITTNTPAVSTSHKLHHYASLTEDEPAAVAAGETIGNEDGAPLGRRISATGAPMLDVDLPGEHGGASTPKSEDEIDNDEPAVRPNGTASLTSAGLADELEAADVAMPLDADADADDDSDRFSLRSDSSWKRERGADSAGGFAAASTAQTVNKKPSFRLSLREEAARHDLVPPPRAPGHSVSQASPSRQPRQVSNPVPRQSMPMGPPTATPGRTLSLRGTADRPGAAQTPRAGGFKRHSLRSDSRRPDPAELLGHSEPPALGRRSSVGSDRSISLRGNRQSANGAANGGGGFLLSLRDEQPGRGSSRNTRGQKASADSGPVLNGFRSRFADSDSDDDAAMPLPAVPPLSHPSLPEPLGVQANKSTNKLKHMFSPSNTAKVLVPRRGSNAAAAADEGSMSAHVAAQPIKEPSSMRKASSSKLRNTSKASSNTTGPAVYNINGIEVVDKYSPEATKKKKRFNGLRRIFGLND